LFQLGLAAALVDQLFSLDSALMALRQADRWVS
jgi:hypothetical protein